MLTLVRRISACQVRRLTSAPINTVDTVNTKEDGKFDVIRHAEDTPTHTGQHWDSHDPRMARFVNREKLVNERYATDLVQEAAPIASKERIVSCDGGGGPLGHPKVFINLVNFLSISLFGLV